ncbi:MAG TPA: TM0106 family RecB-like putative nuclease [Candidatus Dormibacteraeota bacterium]
MRNIEGRLLLGATDLADFLACEHLTQLEIRRAGGQAPPRGKTAMARLLAELGGEHESRWVDAREQAGSNVHRFDPDATRDATTIADLERAAAATVAAMREGFDVIYQPFFFDGRWQGRADFLIRIDRPSALGDWAYEVYDAKLARHVRAEALLQLSEYSLQVSRVMESWPERMHVVLGSDETRSFPVSDFAAYHRVIRDQVEAALPGVETYPNKVAHCGICDYASFCDARRRADAHLSLVARMRRDQVSKLNAAGVARIEELAGLPRSESVAGLAQPTLDALREQARLQVAGAGRDEQPPLWELLPPSQPGFGLEALPQPSPWDVFFDMEGDAFTQGEPIEYLFGALEIVDGEPSYHHWIGHTPAQERLAFEQFIDWIIERLDAHPGMHVYHYADYERSALQRLMGRHGTREAEVDRLLRGGVLVDLYRIVRQSVRLSTEGYGLKQVERLYMPVRSGEVADGEGSILMYARWEKERDPALLASIVRYNAVDCESTAGLRAWLEQRRDDAERAGGFVLGRPSLRDGAASEAVLEQQNESDALRDRLVRDVPDGVSERSAAQQGAWLMAQLLGYHRREQKVEWWRWFGHIALTEDELAEDREALGPLTYVEVVGTSKKSDVVRYRFESQEHAIREGSHPAMPVVRDGLRDAARVGTAVRVDNVAGTIDIARGNKAAQRGHPRFLIPQEPYGVKAQTAALRAVGLSIADNGIDGAGPYRAGRDLLLRRTPRGAAAGPLRASHESAEAAAVRIAGALEGGFLAVQGPPGAGKTYTAARIALDLVSRGKRVAVTATAHKVISRLLGEIGEAAAAGDQAVRIVQKADEDDVCGGAAVQRAGSNDDVAAALADGSADIVGGTAWLFADEKLEARFDTLIVDEAAQMSLADVIACSRCARNLVLVGDPRQLSQVVQGSHPPGVGLSALNHLLQDQSTVTPESGIFLDRTWRMAPEVCAFVSDAFYQGRLQPVEACARQAVAADDGTRLHGLYAAPVAHDGDRTFSRAEAERVREIFTALLGRRWHHCDGTERVLGIADIVVVAPYNAQVACLSAALPDGARVGTVDRFQGQEAAVSIFSLTTSSAEDLPRNLEFLYSAHRLNVAVSRARCMSVLVHSPALLRTRCRTPEQMRLVNALCRYVEVAAPWPARSGPGQAEQLTLTGVV